MSLSVPMMRTPLFPTGLGLGMGGDSLGPVNILALQALVSPGLAADAGVDLSFTRASAQIVEDYEGNLYSAPSGVPAFRGARWDGEKTVLDDGSGNLLHPAAPFSFRNRGYQRLAHYAPWTARLQKESGDHVLPVGSRKYLTNGAAKVPYIDLTLVAGGADPGELTDNGDGTWDYVDANAGAGYANIQDTSAFTIGRLYEITYDVIEITGSTRVTLSGSSRGYVTAVGSYVDRMVASSQGLYVQCSLAGTAKVGNITAKEIPRTSLVEPLRLSDGTITNLVRNGEFTSDTVWAKTSASATISDGVAKLNAMAQYGGIHQDSIITIGKRYRINFDVSEHSSGSIRIYDGATWHPIIATGDGETTGVFVATGTDIHLLNPDATVATMNIDNVVVYELDKRGEPANTNGLYYEERVVNGGFDLDYGWDLTDGEFYIDSGKLKCTTVAATKDAICASVPDLIGKRLKVSFGITNRTSGSLATYVGGVYVGSTINADGLYEFIIEEATSTSPIRFRNNIGWDGEIDDVSVYEIDADGNPVNVLDGGRRVAQTNLMTYSEAAGSWGSNLNVTVTANDAVAPDGTTTADLITCNAGDLLKRIGIFTLTESATAYTPSFFIKPGTQQFYQMNVSNDSSVWVNFDLVNLTVSENGTCKGFIEEAGNGFYRISMVYIGAATLASGIVLAVDSLASARGATSTTTGTFHVWGAMLHTGMGPSDRPAYEYIPTTTASVTEQAHTNIQWNVGGLYQEQIGLLVEPAATNKCTCYSFPPADDIQSELWSDVGVTVQTNWTDNGDGSYSATAASAAQQFYNTTLWASGKVYEVTYTISEYVAGSLVFRAGADASVTSTARSANGTYTERFTVSVLGNTATIFHPVSTFTGKVSGISVKEIKWAIGTYATAALSTNIPGFTPSGDAAGILSIVTADAEAEARFGQLPGWAGKMWSIDNSGGAAAFYFLASGATASVTDITYSAYGKATGTVQVELSSTGDTPVNMSTTGYDRVSDTYTSGGASRQLAVTAAAGGVAVFAIPQLEESAYVTSPILTSGATGTRAATNIDFPLSVLAQNGFTYMLDFMPFFDESVTTGYLMSVYEDGNEEYYITQSSADRYSMGRDVGGVGSASVVSGFTVDANKANRVALRYDAPGIRGFVDTVAGPQATANEDVTVDAVYATLGRRVTANHINGLIKNFFMLHATETDANMQEITGYDN